MNILDKYNHHLSIYKIMHDKYSELVISKTFRMFALSLIALFLPIYLLKNSYTLIELFVFELLLISSAFIVHPITCKFTIPKIGIKKTIILSYFLTILYYIVLNNLTLIINYSNKYIFLLLLGIVNMISTSTFWISYHLYFIKSTKNEDKGKKMGIITSIPVALGVISPFVGSLLIHYFSFSLTFLVSIILLFGGSVPLFYSEDIKINTKMNIKNILNMKETKNNMLFVIQGMITIATGLFWPLLLFLINIKTISMGLLYLASNLIYAIISYYSGKMSDKNKAKKLIKLGSGGHGVSLILRAFSKTILGVTSFQTLGGLFGAMWEVPLYSLFYKKSSLNAIDSVLNREFYLHIGRLSLIIVSLFMIKTFNPVLVLSSIIIITGLFTFFMSYFAKEY